MISQLKHSFYAIVQTDNVATALDDMEPGIHEVFGAIHMQVCTKETIPYGHKVALADLAEREDVIKYGYPIGIATSFIPKGGMVGIHNCASKLGTDAQDQVYRPTQSTQYTLIEYDTRGRT